MFRGSRLTAKAIAFAKRSIGRVLFKRYPIREDHTLHPMYGEPSLARRLTRFAALHRMVERSEFDRLRDCHRSFWNQSQDFSWYENTEERFEKWFLANFEPFVGELGRIIDERGSRELYELGTGAGQVLHYLSQQIDQIQQFVGIDVNEAQIARNCATYRESPLRFVARSATDWISNQAKPNSVYFTNAGVLEYVAPEELTGMIARTAHRLAPSLWAVIEPLDHGHDIDSELDSRIYGEELSFSHPYPHLFSQAGFQVLYREERVVDRYRFLSLIAASPSLSQVD